MPITMEQRERLDEILDGLEPFNKDMGGASSNFVEDQRKRLAEHGDNIMLSPKQWAWLEDLYGRYVEGKPRELR